MNSSFDPGALMARSYVLPRGPRVCLRLARVRDQVQIADLLERQGESVDELELARLVHCDPRRQLVICATALVGVAESVVGVGAMAVTADPGLEPCFVVVDDQLTDGLGELLSDALVGRVQALARARAA